LPHSLSYLLFETRIQGDGAQTAALGLEGLGQLDAEGAAGAARFSSGKGRHGDFSDI
jgi:hypothetical protein